MFVIQIEESVIGEREGEESMTGIMIEVKG